MCQLFQRCMTNAKCIRTIVGIVAIFTLVTSCTEITVTLSVFVTSPVTTLHGFGELFVNSNVTDVRVTSLYTGLVVLDVLLAATSVILILANRKLIIHQLYVLPWMVVVPASLVYTAVLTGLLYGMSGSSRDHDTHQRFLVGVDDIYHISSVPLCWCIVKITGCAAGYVGVLLRVHSPWHTTERGATETSALLRIKYSEYASQNDVGHDSYYDVLDVETDHKSGRGNPRVMATEKFLPGKSRAGDITRSPGPGNYHADQIGEPIPGIPRASSSPADSEGTSGTSPPQQFFTDECGTSSPSPPDVYQPAVDEYHWETTNEAYHST